MHGARLLAFVWKSLSEGQLDHMIYKKKTASATLALSKIRSEAQGGQYTAASLLLVPFSERLFITQARTGFSLRSGQGRGEVRSTFLK